MENNLQFILDFFIIQPQKKGYQSSTIDIPELHD
jgi:hypothetical protein